MFYLLTALIPLLFVPHTLFVLSTPLLGLEFSILLAKMLQKDQMLDLEMMQKMESRREEKGMPAGKIPKQSS